MKRTSCEAGNVTHNVPSKKQATEQGIHEEIVQDKIFLFWFHKNLQFLSKKGFQIIVDSFQLYEGNLYLS